MNIKKHKNLIISIILLTFIVIATYISLSFATSITFPGGIVTIDGNTSNAYCATKDADNPNRYGGGQYAGTIHFRSDGMYIDSAKLEWNDARLRLAWVVLNAGLLPGGDNQLVAPEAYGNYSTTQKLLWTYLGPALGNQYNIAFAGDNDTWPGCADYRDSDIEPFVQAMRDPTGSADIYISHNTEGLETPKVENYVLPSDGQEYYKIGPLEVQYPSQGRITDYQVSLTNGSTVAESDRKFLNKDGSEIGGDQVGNASAFYVIVRKAAIGSSQVSSIKVKVNRNHKYISAEATMDVYISTKSQYQSVVKVTNRGSVTEETQVLEDSINVSTPPTDDYITIRKYRGQTRQSPDTSSIMGDVAFTIKKDDGGYINTDGLREEGGIWTTHFYQEGNVDNQYVPDKEKAILWTSDGKVDVNNLNPYAPAHEIKLKGFEDGNYTIIEVDCAAEWAKDSDQHFVVRGGKIYGVDGVTPNNQFNFVNIPYKGEDSIQIEKYRRGEENTGRIQGDVAFRIRRVDTGQYINANELGKDRTEIWIVGSTGPEKMYTNDENSAVIWTNKQDNGHDGNPADSENLDPNAEGEIRRLKGFQDGTYEIIEADCPVGWSKAKSQTFIVKGGLVYKKDGTQDNRFIFINEPYNGEDSITIQKYKADDNGNVDKSKIAGDVGFAIRRDDVQGKELYINTDGLSKEHGIWTTHFYQEENASNQYVTDIEKGILWTNKKDNGNEGDPLNIKKLDPNAEGEERKLKGFEDGKYTIIEVHCPEGWKKDTEKHFTVRDGKVYNDEPGGTTNVFTFINTKDRSTLKIRKYKAKKNSDDADVEAGYIGGIGFVIEKVDDFNKEQNPHRYLNVREMGSDQDANIVDPNNKNRYSENLGDSVLYTSDPTTNPIEPGHELKVRGLEDGKYIMIEYDVNPEYTYDKEPDQRFIVENGNIYGVNEDGSMNRDPKSRRTF